MTTTGHIIFSHIVIFFFSVTNDKLMTLHFTDASVFTPTDLRALLLDKRRINPLYLGYFATKTTSRKLKHLFSKLSLRQEAPVKKEKDQFGHVTLLFGPSDPII